MKIMIAGIMGFWEIILIVAILIILFGARKIPELARGLGTSIKELRKAGREATGDVSVDKIETSPLGTPPVRPDPQPHLPSE